MAGIFLYIMKSSVYLAAFYIIYSLLLRRDTIHKRNRAYILLSMALSLSLPFFSLNAFKPADTQVFGRLLSEILVTAEPGPTMPDNQAGIIPGNLILIVYLAGVSAVILKLIFDLSGLLFMIRQNRNPNSRIIKFSGSLITAGFSALGYIFINRNLSEENEFEIIRHEENHIRHNHYLDILFVEIITSLQWFNPFIFLFNRELRAVHEFQADEECLNHGITVPNYQKLLFSQVFKAEPLKMTNSFSNPSLLRKRMIMMTKKRSSSSANLKLLAGIPFIGLTFIILSSFTLHSDNLAENNVNINLNSTLSDVQSPPPPPPVPAFTTTNGDTTWYVPDVMPKFPGGDIAILRYVVENTVYPATAKDNSIQGKVIVTFIINKDGSIGDAKIMKGVTPEIDAEALRVIRSMPDFEQPGFKDGKAVPVWYMLPISFTLN